ncbi:MAG: translation initiation factor IF-3 [Herpetosiphon sp.]
MRGETTIRDQKARVNRRIRVPQVRVIGEEGEQLGIMPTFQALEMAEERGLDLVEVAPNADPPVCRLMDYGKYLYDQQKKDREARKNQKTVDIKEVRLSPNSDEHYIEVKTTQARQFLQEGDKVKFTVRFRGRQLAHTNIGMEMLEQIAETLRDVSVVEQRPMPEGKSYTLLIAPGAPKSVRRERPAPSTPAPIAPAPAATLSEPEIPTTEG